MTLHSDYSAETQAAFRRIRRIATIALGVAFVHVVFGAIVRISGSGMGCDSVSRSWLTTAIPGKTTASYWRSF